MNGEPTCQAHIAVIGSGAFGTALAAVSAASGKARVTLVARRNSLVEEITRTGRNEAALPGIDLPQILTVSSDPAVLRTADIVLLAMPSQAQRDAARSLQSFISEKASVVICAKGLERSSGRLLTSVVEEELPGRAISVLSGPGFAADIARGLPTAMVVAAQDLSRAGHLAETLSGATFRLYPSADRIGVQLCGALKNVLAIACGIVEGAGLGESARAALIARGLAEMSRFTSVQGGDGDTARGLSGLGDLVLTATSHQSRNLRYGISLGRGQQAQQTGELIEGALAAATADRIASERGIDMPVTRAVTAIIDEKIDVKTALHQLMSRPITQE